MLYTVNYANIGSRIYVMLTNFYLEPIRNHPEIQHILEMAKAKHDVFKINFVFTQNK